MKKLNKQIVKKKYKVFYDRISKVIQISKKKQALYDRLKRHKNHLKHWGITVVSVITLLPIPTAATGQSFTAQTGTSNPFNGVDVGLYSNPTFVDIDNDGDLDAFIGEYYGTIKYYKNTGTNNAPSFTEQTGTSNLFNGVDVGDRATLIFVDIDNDGDFDAFIGAYTGMINYYKNTGTNNTPVFTLQTGTNNPFNGVDVGYQSAPTFVDIDNDGDFDAFIGEYYGTIKYYKNTGTNNAPSFTAQTGTSNPFNGVDVGFQPATTFIDIDNDEDFDAFIGELDGIIDYYKNTGTKNAPVFTIQTSTNNPFNGVDVGGYSYPTFVDIDNDGDFDAFIGETDGFINYYQNTSAVLPVELTDFTANAQDNQTNLLEWQTASEENNKGFEVQRNAEGQEWQTLGFVKGNGTTLETQNYTFIDEHPIGGNNYYRLKQTDFDGQFEYSNILSVKTKVFGEEIKIYPNPVQDKLTITNTENIENIVIYNALGQLLRQFTINNSQLSIHVSDLPKGIYILKVQDINGVITTQQFLK